MAWEEQHDYFARHWRLRRDRGKASSYRCEHCKTEQARDWAQIHGTDGEDPLGDYVPLCRKCHIAYDGSGHHVPHTDEAKQKMSRSHRQAYAEGRRVGSNSFQSGKTHCPQKHPYDDANTYIDPDGSRQCRECRRDRKRRWRQGRQRG